MRLLWLVLALLMAAPQAQAAICPPNKKLALVGSLSTNSAVLTTSASEVQLIAVQCGGSACTAGFYDTTTLTGASVANGRLEIGAAANSMAYFPAAGLLDQPLTFTSGVVFVDDGNVSAVTAYSCQAR
jgi:hypothetical protein